MALYFPLLPEFVQDMLLLKDGPVISPYSYEEMACVHCLDVMFAVTIMLKYGLAFITYIPVIKVILAYGHGGTLDILYRLVVFKDKLLSFHSHHLLFRFLCGCLSLFLLLSVSLFLLSFISPLFPCWKTHTGLHADCLILPGNMTLECYRGMCKYQL